MSSNHSIRRIALCGNPNSGKSSLFNALTGLGQKISNIPGTTIELKRGHYKSKQHSYEIIDTPGTYSIDPKSEDEKIALKIFEPDHPDYPEVIVYVADASNIKRHLFFFSQLAQRGIPMVLVLNLLDVSEAKGVQIDTERLQNELGIPVVATNARKKEGIAELQSIIDGKAFTSHYSFYDNNSEVEEVVQRYSNIDKLVDKTVSIQSKRELLTQKLDPILTHPILGYAIFLGILFIIFQSVFRLSEYPMGLIESGFDVLGNSVRSVLPDNWIEGLLVDGLIAGLSGVIIFIPQIAILFFFIGILEDTGYMARVSFIMDRMLRGLGLSGKSVVPLVSGVACAIPAIMATRTIGNWKDRIITILVTPLMSCSARLPVYTLLIAIAVPETSVWGVFSVQGLLLLAMYVLGTLASLVAALVFKWILNFDGNRFYIMEMPIFHPPRWKSIGLTVLNKSKSFVFEAGKVILLISLVLWFMASYGPGEESTFEQTGQIEQSYAGKFGKSIEPAIKPLGYNWKIGIALITSFAAREVFVGTMATIYSIDSDEPDFDLRNTMLAEVDPVSGNKVYSLATVLSLMVFYAFAMQCMSTLAVVYKETRTWKWPAIQFVYMTALAYVASWITYVLVS